MDVDAIDDALDFANAMLGGHGVEAVRGRWHDRYYMDIVGLYVNMGETYDTTILFDTVQGKFKLMSLGDWVESKDEEYGIE